MDLDEVKGLAERVRSAQTIEDVDGAMPSLRSHFPGCAVVQTPVWGLVLLVKYFNAKFTQEDLDSVREALAFDCIVIREAEGLKTIFGLIPESEARLYDQDVFSSGEATGDSRWSHL